MIINTLKKAVQKEFWIAFYFLSKALQYPILTAPACSESGIIIFETAILKSVNIFRSEVFKSLKKVELTKEINPEPSQNDLLWD